jgi:hypothetical protein
MRAGLLEIPPRSSGLCRCGCGMRVSKSGGKNSHRRRYVSGHNEFVGAKRWRNDGRRYGKEIKRGITTPLGANQ